MLIRVKKLLTEHPRLRDDDQKLIANIYYGDLKALHYDCEKVSGHQVLKVLSNGGLSNTESITRARRKIQEEHPELRGKSYSKRQDNTEHIIEQVRNYGN